MTEPAAKKTAASKAPAQPTVWDLLAAPFPQEDLERLPRNLQRDDRDRGRCVEGSRYSADGYYCQGYHARSIHLDYVGHAGITTRLNDVLGPGGWTFQPMAYTSEGLPLMSRDQFWATLTITVDDQTVAKTDVAANFNGVQEAWGDALRRCAMRFGVGTYLWSKSEAAHAKAKFQDEPADESVAEAPALRRDQQILADRVDSLSGDARQKFGPWWESNNLPPLPQTTVPQVAWVMEQMDKRDAQAEGQAPDPS